MRIEDIEVIEKSLEGLKIKRKTLDNIRRFVESIVVNERIHISIDGQTLNNAYELFGDGILKVVQDKQLEIEKEIHSFTLDQLLPSNKINKDEANLSKMILKFDIFERVQLTPDDKAIIEMGGADLTPVINYYKSEESECGSLDGHLILVLNYLTHKDVITKYSHRIPVEISIANTSIENCRDFTFEVDNLNVEKVGMRCVNVSGKLIVSIN